MKPHPTIAAPAAVLAAVAALAATSFAAVGHTGARPLDRNAAAVVVAVCAHRVGNGHQAISKH
jgi:hypothetical protein